MIDTSSHIAAHIHNPIPKQKAHGGLKKHCPTLMHKNLSKLERMILKKSKIIESII